ncbi:signal peptidase I [Enterococcus crotali]
MGYSKKKGHKQMASQSKRVGYSLEEKKKLGKAKKKKLIREWSINFLFILVLLLVLLFLVQVKTHQVEGHSMNPTLANKDRILVVKGQQPKRYELVTFEPKDSQGESYVKRIIGMPGDVIWIEGVSLYINQQAENNPPNLYGHDLAASNLPDGTTRILVSEAVAKELKQYYQIPDNTYFVQGDNRNHSDDSRVLGLIDSNQIEGIVTYRYYPFNKIGVVR